MRLLRSRGIGSLFIIALSSAHPLCATAADLIWLPLPVAQESVLVTEIACNEALLDTLERYASLPAADPASLAVTRDTLLEDEATLSYGLYLVQALGIAQSAPSEASIRQLALESLQTGEFHRWIPWSARKYIYEIGFDSFTGRIRAFLFDSTDGYFAFLKDGGARVLSAFQVDRLAIRNFGTRTHEENLLLPQIRHSIRKLDLFAAPGARPLPSEFYGLANSKGLGVRWTASAQDRGGFDHSRHLRRTIP